MEASHVAADLEKVILTEEQILARVGALAADLRDQFLSRTPVLVGVLGGAATFTVDLARAYPAQVEIGWMAVKSYSTGNRASGSVRLLKDLDVDIASRDVVIVDGVIDTGLTMSWLIANLAQREPASITVCALLRKPEAVHLDASTPTYVGFDVGEGLIVGYGMDHDGHYRNLRCAAILSPEVYAARRGRRVAPHGRT
ncbi:phosphoribosyltransferase family protein [Actinoplanes sp. Pm04-4]|uniref:Hypoxanthine-guanine phosphoribosyltransferase n=1 Tax=Paractinoplanes pyxinae TaxID=2997416 RepID=A0ABT4AZ98_9ACTN|nr:phosphoribosyltransferase family protein [Actinoplanes pyxinae]MCY1139529.1 phosphoribosyltransferase family protein [Actinoplanes pyxinae]